MKKILLIVLGFFLSVNMVFASSYDWHFNLRDSTDTSDINHDLDVNDNSRDRVIAVEGSTLLPKVYDLGADFFFDNMNNQLRLNLLPITQIDGLATALENKSSQTAMDIIYGNVADLSEIVDDKVDMSVFDSALDDVDTRLDSAESTISSHTTTLASLAPQIQTDWTQTSSGALDFVKHKPEVWHNGSKLGTSKSITFSGTTTSGSAVFYLTDNGASNGNALCSSTPTHINPVVNDPSNTFGVGYAITNSNKTLTITVNVRDFSGITILGIPVLGSTALNPASNGTAVGAVVSCS